MSAAGSEAPARTAQSGSDAFDSPFDGVWVGLLDATVAGTKRPYPVLVNLDVRDTSGSGLLLLADDLAGTPTRLDFLPVALQAKGKKIDLTATQGDGARAQQLAATLRLKKDVLKGSFTSSAQGFKKSRIELRRLDTGAPLQHLWSGTLAGARGASEPVALTVWTGPSVSGAGFVGTSFGNLANATVVNGRLTGRLRTQDGDVELDLTIDRQGYLGGSVDGRPLDGAPLTPGATSTLPTIRKLKPSSLPAGVTTTVAIKGKNLAAGFLLHVDVKGVYAGLPQVQSARKATVALTVAADVAAGTPVQLHLAAATGDVATSKAKLETGGATAVSFSSNILPVFTSTCGIEGCHVQPPLDDPAYPDDAMPAGDLILDGPVAFVNIVGVASTERPELNRIEPFDAERSYMIRKLRGDGDILGDRMPQDGPPYLSPEMIDMFIRWVNAGAPRS